MNNGQTPATLTETVNHLLMACDSPAVLTIEQCALQLSMSMTTFRRKLTQEGTSYKLIQHKFLNALCVKALLNTKVKIEDLSVKLGYSERATFERAFKQKFGISPIQFRKQSLVSQSPENKACIIAIAQSMPPMPESCRQLIQNKEENSLDLPSVLAIVEKDPIFSGRIIGLASKAIYGKTPENLAEAISRNIGIEAVINIAIVYAMKDALESNINPLIVNQYSHALLLAPKLFRLIKKNHSLEVNFDNAITEQILCFALIGIFLLCHQSSNKHELILHAMQGIDDLSLLNQHIHQATGISIFSASALMLSLWHMDAVLIKQLNHLDKLAHSKAIKTTEIELILFMLSTLYAFASGHHNTDGFTQQAKRLHINNYKDIINLMTLSSGEE